MQVAHKRIGIRPHAGPHCLPPLLNEKIVGTEFLAILNEVQARRRRARYIGHEREYERMAGSNSDERYLRLLHPAQFRGPSDT